MNGHDVAMRRMMGADAFNVWTKQFTRGFLPCEIVDYFEKLSNSMLQEIYDRDFFWYDRFRELQNFGGTVLRVKIPERLRDRRKTDPVLNWTFRRDPGPHYAVRRGDKS